MKKGQILGLLSLIFLLGPYFVSAQVPPPGQLEPPEIPTRLFSCLPSDSLRKCMLRLLDDVLRVILVIALAGAALMIAWAGIQYIRGTEDTRKDAKNKLIYAALGLVVAFLAWVLTAMLARIIGGAAL